MRPELEQRLHTISKERLIQLLLELAIRHPVLLAEMISILESLTEESLPEAGNPPEDIDEEVTEDWDFSGDEQAASPPSLRPAPLSSNSQAHQQHIEEYVSLLREEKSPQVLVEVLTRLIEEATSHSEQNNYHNALDLFALLFDERLLERTAELTSIFDEMIAAAIPSLENLLSGASSNTLFDAGTATLSPLIPPNIRHRWLERLFALWLKQLDAHRIEEDLPEIMLDVAWNEDIALLRSLTQNELQRQPYGDHSNIVDLTSQYRTKALEKFLKELPRT